MKNNIKVREQIWQCVSEISDSQLNKVVEEGQWSIAQVLEHLYLIEKLAVEGIQEALASSEANPVKLRRIHLAADRSHKVQAPEMLRPSAEYQTLKQLKNKLDNSRETLLKCIEGVSVETLDEKSMPHPVYGALSLSQWISFIGYHEQRHLGQIEDIKELLVLK
ncbi:DinB family protein [Lysinibacillus telephonicus]|uniref:DinB family protein n=2 Tax=Lysinibacillus telephonicus TaxID=1714840 RepID=UPI00397C3BEE